MTIILISAIIWQLYRARWSPLARARKAVQIVADKQKADFLSYAIRTELMLNKLTEARRMHNQSLQEFDQFAAQLGNEIDSEAEIIRANAYTRVTDRQRQLESATNMVRAFHESLPFFRKKWTQQISKLTTDFPLTLKKPQQSGLNVLYDIPSGLSEPEAQLGKGLRIDD